MSRRYGEVVSVEITKTAPGEGYLYAFTWRGVSYPVAEILGDWHLQTRWWDSERRLLFFLHRTASE
jgi:hypothetical protein